MPIVNAYSYLNPVLFSKGKDAWEMAVKKK
jgi:hypothetical protein